MFKMFNKMFKKIAVLGILSFCSASAFALETQGNGQIDLQISNTKHNELKAKNGFGLNSKINFVNPQENGFTAHGALKFGMGKNSYQQGGVNFGWRLGKRFNINPYAGFGAKLGKYKFDDNIKLKQRRAYAELGAVAELHFIEDKFFIQPTIAYQHDFYNQYKIDGFKDKEKGHAINTELAFNFKVTESSNTGDSVYLRVAPYHEYYTNKTKLMGGSKHKYRESGIRVGLKF